MTASTDRALLEAAAKAVGIRLREWREGAMYADAYGAMLTEDGLGDRTWWNPLTDDGDAMRLVVKLKMQLFVDTDQAEAMDTCPPYKVGREEVMNTFVRIEGMEDHPDPYAATRRAIVRAAAEVGRASSSGEAG